MTSPFEVAGFSAIVTACSADPDTDGYLGSRAGLPFHIHPEATPAEWAMLEAALGAGDVTPQAFTQAVPTIEEARAERHEAIRLACAAEITNGFSSSALGEAHHYPSLETDQLNLTANVLSSLLPGLASGWTTPQIARSQDGGWSYHDHTAAQIQQVGTDCKAMIAAALVRKNMLDAAIEVANSVPAVEAIGWT